MTFQPHRILHPTDFSECSQYAFGIAVDLARQNSAQLIILHAVPLLDAGPVSYGEMASELEPTGNRRRIEDDLRRTVPPPSDVLTHYLLAEGDPVTEIVQEARARDCDLIVIGTHGRTGLQHLLMGSVAEQVVRRAPCPVLSVKLPSAPT